MPNTLPNTLNGLSFKPHTKPTMVTSHPHLTKGVNEAQRN